MTPGDVVRTDADGQPPSHTTSTASAPAGAAGHQTSTADRHLVTPPKPIPALEQPGRSPLPAATVLRPLLVAIFGSTLPVRFELWDGSTLGPSSDQGCIRIRSIDALRRLLWAPGELGVARAFVAGDIELDGDIFTLLRVAHEAAPSDLRRVGTRVLPAALRAARQLGVLGWPPAPPAEEAGQALRRHTPARDAEVISHHYDVGNDFYAMVLGPSMTYSCARFVDPGTSLEDAQRAKHELICRKLGLHERSGMRLLDVGCGWGSMVMHAAAEHGASAVGITLSHQQAELARQRVADAGLADRVEVRLQDYRDLHGEQFDAISSIGMFEHVGAVRMAQYFETLHGLLAPRGRLCNHAISTPGGSRIGRRTFIGRYVFPDGELIDVGEVVLAMERAGFEVRDVESLREHYSKTLHAWVANLEAHWDEALALVGPGRARIWRLYLAGSANGFDDGGLAVHQVLGVRPADDGTSGMPPTRQSWG